MAIIIDTSHLLYRLIHMNVDKIKENPEFLSHIVLTSINYNANRFGASKTNPVILAIDSYSWRKKFYEENKTKFPEYKVESYKGNRKKDDSIPWKEIFEIYNIILETVKKHSDYYVIKVESAEADDIIAISAKYYRQKNQQVFIISSDKDFIQLQDEPHVVLYDPLKNIFKPQINIERWKKIHILIGDASDNIFAVKPRLGEKTAEKMINDLDSILQTNPEIKDRYEFNKILIDFDCIPKEIEDSIIIELEKQEHSYNAMELIKCFKQYRLAKVIDNINNFKLRDGIIKTKLNTHFSEKAKIENINNNSLEDFFND